MNTLKEIALWFTDRARDAHSRMAYRYLDGIKAALNNNQMAVISALVSVIKGQDEQLTEYADGLQDVQNENERLEEEVERKDAEINNLRRKVQELEYCYEAGKTHRDQIIELVLENANLKREIAELERAKSE